MRVSCNSDCCILDPEELGWERERKRERERGEDHHSTITTR
jgi:hypothetical protein